MAVTNADYSTVIEAMRSALAKGTKPSEADIKLTISVVKAAADRLAAAKTEYDSQIATLQAGGAGDISAEVDAAQTALDAPITTAPTYVTNTVADG